MVLAAGVVALGFVLGVAPHTLANIQWRAAPSGLSIFYGVLSSLFIAVHAVLIKVSLPHAHNSTIQLAYWQNLGSAIFLAPFIVIQGEYGRLFELIGTREWNAGVFIWGSLITGVFGFLLCVAGLLSIKVTSPVTHMFSSVSALNFNVKKSVLIDCLPCHPSYLCVNVSGGSLCDTNVAGRVVVQRPSHKVSI